MKDSLNASAAELVCSTKNCTASKMVTVYMYEQDFGFCNHHYQELKDLLPDFAEVEELETAGS